MRNPSNQRYDGSLSNRKLAWQGRSDDELRGIHEEQIEHLAPVRVLVRDGRPVCPEGAELQRRKNARPPAEERREPWNARRNW
jgi:hypothetical protein